MERTIETEITFIHPFVLSSVKMPRNGRKASPPGADYHRRPIDRPKRTRMESRFARRVMMAAMVVGLALSVLYASSSSPNHHDPAHRHAADIAK